MRKDGHQPLLIVIAGPNGSGKTTITSQVLESEWLEDAIYINPDNVANEMYGDWNSADAVKNSAIYCENWRNECLENRQSLIFETVMSSREKIDFILRAKKAGYFVRVFFVATSSPTINASRIAQRVMEGGHDVPIPKIISRYLKSIANCATVGKIVDRLYVYDNSVDGADARLLFRLSDGKVAKRYTCDMPQWVEGILPTD